jgi:cytochrome c oxidase accessory protein FixG
MTVNSAAPPAQPAPERISLYEKWRKIYPMWVDGSYQRWRRVMLLVLLLIFYVSPWLTWNGQRGVHFDLEHRRFTLFFVTFVPEEFYLLAWALIIAAFTLFFVTVVAGRIFCGWACPQTVWSLVYFTIEYLVEGDRSARIRLDNGRWSAERIRKKALKFGLWGLLALSISITFMGYFQPLPEFLPRLFAGDLSTTEWAVIGLPAVATFMMQGVLREQVCFHMCPYARFQSVMFDRDTLIIAYDAERGEPRGKRRRGVEPEEAGLGSCIDCKKCVSVCPTGIDIRDGLQYQCIGCANCIDVCNDVMDQMGYPRDLVRYSSENRDEHVKAHRIRPRLIGYLVMLMVVSSAFTWQVTHRDALSLDVSRDRSRLYRENWDGSVENVFTLHVQNRTKEAETYSLGVEGDAPFTWEGPREIEVAGGQRQSVSIRLVMSPDAPTSAAQSPVFFSIEATDDPDANATKKSRFIRPEEVHGE